eukprot:gene19305-25953_t
MSYSPPFGPLPRRKRTASPLLPAVDLAGTSNLASCSRARFSGSAHRARVLGPSSSQATASIAVEDSESSGPEDFGPQVHVTVFYKRTPKADLNGQEFSKRILTLTRRMFSSMVEHLTEPL